MFKVLKNSYLEFDLPLFVIPILLELYAIYNILSFIYYNLKPIQEDVIIKEQMESFIFQEMDKVSFKTILNTKTLDSRIPKQSVTAEPEMPKSLETSVQQAAKVLEQSENSSTDESSSEEAAPRSGASQQYKKDIKQEKLKQKKLKPGSHSGYRKLAGRFFSEVPTTVSPQFLKTKNITRTIRSFPKDYQYIEDGLTNMVHKIRNSNFYSVINLKLLEKMGANLRTDKFKKTVEQAKLLSQQSMGEEGVKSLGSLEVKGFSIWIYELKVLGIWGNDRLLGYKLPNSDLIEFIVDCPSAHNKMNMRTGINELRREIDKYLLSSQTDTQDKFMMRR